MWLWPRSGTGHTSKHIITCNFWTNHCRDIRLAPRFFVIAFAKSWSPIRVSRLSVCYFAKRFSQSMLISTVCPFVTLRKATLFRKVCWSVAFVCFYFAKRFSQSMLISTVCPFVCLHICLSVIALAAPIMKQSLWHLRRRSVLPSSWNSRNLVKIETRSRSRSSEMYKTT